MSRVVVAILLALLGVASAREGSEGAGEPQAAAASSAARFDDTGRLYFSVDTGFHFTLDHEFAGDVEIDPPSGVDWDLGGGVGYNITRNWGVELQFQGIDPDLRSASRGTIREISVLTFVPAVRYRWPIGDGRWLPYVTGGVGMSSIDIHDEERPYAQAKTSSTTVVGSLSAGFDYFLTENVAAGLETRYMIHPNQDATVIYQHPHGGGATRFTDSLNLTSVSLLAQLKFFPGQQASADGTERTFFLADHGPFDTDELRVYLSGLFGYDFLFDKDGGAGVRFRDKGGDFNLTKGGALGLNVDGHWGGEVELLVTPLNVRLASGGPRFEKLNVFEIVPTVRYRWPLLEGRLVPFVTAGLGASYLMGNDQRPQVEFQKGRGQVVVYPRYDVDSPSLVGSVGGGVEYFLNRHLSVGLDVPLRFYPAQDSVLRRTGHPTQTGSANFSGLLALLQIKAYIP
jgi:opacity protein-like surface antigen